MTRLTRFLRAPMTTTEGSFDGRRTLSNKGMAVVGTLLLGTVITAIAAPGTIVAAAFAIPAVILLVGGGVLGAALDGRDYARRRNQTRQQTNTRSQSPIELHKSLKGVRTPEDFRSRETGAPSRRQASNGPSAGNGTSRPPEQGPLDL